MLTNKNLPALPLRKSEYGFDDMPSFTADQMREYARAVEQAAYERAAQWIEGAPATDGGMLTLTQSFIAVNLRALKEPQ